MTTTLTDHLAHVANTSTLRPTHDGRRSGGPYQARHMDVLSEAESRAIELDENIERLDLDTYEISQQRSAELKVEAVRLMEKKAEAAQANYPPHAADKSPKRDHNKKTGGKKTGRPKGVKATRTELAAVTGITLRPAKTPNRQTTARVEPCEG